MSVAIYAGARATLEVCEEGRVGFSVESLDIALENGCELLN